MKEYKGCNKRPDMRSIKSGFVLSELEIILYVRERSFWA